MDLSSLYPRSRYSIAVVIPIPLFVLRDVTAVWVSLAMFNHKEQFTIFYNKRKRISLGIVSDVRLKSNYFGKLMMGIPQNLFFRNRNYTVNKMWVSVYSLEEVPVPSGRYECCSWTIGRSEKMWWKSASRKCLLSAVWQQKLWRLRYQSSITIVK